MTDQTPAEVPSPSGAAARRLAVILAIATAVQFVGLLVILRVAKAYPNAYVVFLIVKLALFLACMVPAVTLFRAQRWGAGALFVLLGLIAYGISTWVSGIGGALLMGGFGAW